MSLPLRHTPVLHFAGEVLGRGGETDQFSDGVCEEDTAETIM